MTLRDKAWSPYAAGVLIGLLQIPAFLLIETALGTSVVRNHRGAHCRSRRRFDRQNGLSRQAHVRHLQVRLGRASNIAELHQQSSSRLRR